jgi:predicted AAA+ superfamily ATPase
VINFEEVLNSLLKRRNVDIYVTGSNAKFLSKDIITEFRGRGDQVHVYPLSFSEFWEYYRQKHSGIVFPMSFPNPNGLADINSAWQEYITFGGMPGQVTMDNVQDKSNYLKSLFDETYIRDIIDRNNVRNKAEIEELIDIVASDIGSLTNPLKIANTFKTEKKESVHQETIKNFLDYFEDAFLVSKAKRYDIKGKKYINTPMKYYFTDVGLRNARLNFRQIEETHLMENVIYNELLIRGYNVDVGVVDHYYTDEDNQRRQKKLEVDFVCNQGSNRIYIQSALSIPDKSKMEQEQSSLIKIRDSFRKIIIVKEGISHNSENGIYIMNLFDFLLSKNEAGL